MKEKRLPVDSFILRIIGMITMTFDHLGVFLQIYVRDQNLREFAKICRYIGRIAFPIFVFMLVEGWVHTKNPKKYLLRLGILASTLLIPHFVTYQFLHIEVGGNPLIEIFFLGLTIYCLKLNKGYKLFAIFPIAYICLNFGVSLYEYQTHFNVIWLPEYIRCDYSLLGLIFVFVFSAARPTASFIIKTFYKDVIVLDEYKKTSNYRFLLNCISAAFFLTSVLLLWVIANIFTDASGYCPIDVFSISWEAYCLFALIPILLYSGKKGYSSKGWRIFSYAYFPLHLAVLALIFVLKFGI